MPIHLGKAALSSQPTWLEVERLMNKGELVDAIAVKANVTKKDADTVLSATLDAILEVVAAGNKVTLVGFGSFEQRERQAQEGRNPATGKPIQIPATRVPAFSAGNLFWEKTAATVAPTPKAKGTAK